MSPKLLAPIIFMLFASGCGTLGTLGQNNEYPVQAYAGLTGELGLGESLFHSQFIIEVPFTALADTIVLPYTIPASIVNLSMPAERRKDSGVLGGGVINPTSRIYFDPTANPPSPPRPNEEKVNHSLSSSD